MNPLQNWITHRRQKRSVIHTLSRLLSVQKRDIETLWHSFNKFYREHRYETTLGEAKTLNRLESFITYVMLGAHRPASIIEIGTFYGKSTRRIIDMKSALGLTALIFCYDISDNVSCFQPEEAKLILADITNDPRKHLAEYPAPRFIFLDARPYSLLKNVIQAYLEHFPDTIMTIHDCSPSLCKREMTMDRSCLEISSSTKIWERHVLAECFQKADPLSAELDDIDTPTHRMVIFDTTHGLALLIPKQKLLGLRNQIEQTNSNSG
jgi:hypothetical protein